MCLTFRSILHFCPSVRQSYNNVLPNQFNYRRVTNFLERKMYKNSTKGGNRKLLSYSETSLHQYNLIILCFHPFSTNVIR